MFSRKEVAPIRSYFNELTQRHSQHDNDTSVLSHAAIALYVEHCIAQNERWFVLGGSEDLRALLSRIVLNDTHNEAFILIRPYIHSMGLYLRCDSGQIKAYLFDSQNWGVRYYPTRLIIEAIQKQYPTADILLSGTELQFLDHQSGCEQFALALLQWAASMDSDAPIRNGQRLFTSYAEKKQPVNGYQNVYQQSQNELPACLLNCEMSQNPNWYVQQRKEQIEALETCLKEGYLVNDALDWKKIMSVVKKRQGEGLPLGTNSQALYEIILNEKTLKIVFKTKDMLLYGNLFCYSQALYPLAVRTADSHYVLQSPEITVNYDPDTLTLTYNYQSLKTLLSAVQSLQKPEEVEKLYWNNMRQLLGLEELLHEIKLKIELHKTMKNGSGGFDLGTTLSAISALFEPHNLVKSHEKVYVPSYLALSGHNASLSVSALSSQKYHYIAFPYQANREHQVAVWVDIEHKTVSIINSEPSSPCSSESLSNLGRLLGMPEGDFTYPKPVETQSDDWSCGIHVVRNLMAMHQRDIAFATPAERTECYLRAARCYDRNAQRQHEIAQANEQTLRQLLLWVETARYQQGYFQAANKTDKHDVFKTLADYLQHIVWGNLDRQASPENNTGRNNESQSVLITESLRDICTSYRRKRDNYGLFILQLAAVFTENNRDLKEALPTILSNTMFAKPLGLNGMLDVPSNRGYKDALDVLISEIGMSSKDKSLLDLFHILTSCIQTRDSIQDNQKFIEEFLLIVIGDAGYNSSISTLIKTKVDSFLYDFLAFLANHYLGINQSKLSTLKSHEAERLAFFQKREQEKTKVLQLLEASGITTELEEIDVARLYVYIPLIQQIIKGGCLEELTGDELKSFFYKFLRLQPNSNDIEKLLSVYPEKNARAWGQLMIQAIKKSSANEIAMVKHNGKSILICAEEWKLSSLTDFILEKAGLLLLQIACITGNLYELEILIQHKFDVDVTLVSYGWHTPLTIAVAYGHIACIELLLTAGANPNAVSSNNDTPLHWAARQGHIAIVELLLKAGARPEAVDINDDIALTFAARKGYIAIVQAFLAAGANPDATNHNGQSPLTLAAIFGHTNIVKSLLEKLLLDKLGTTSVLREADLTTICKHWPLIRQLVKEDCLTELTHDEIKCFFDKVLQLQPDSNDIEKLLNLYPEKNARAWGQLMIQALKKSSAEEIAMVKYNGKSILICAEEWKLSSLTDFILEKAGLLLLDSASQNGNLHELSILIQHKIDVNVTLCSFYGDTPLIFAADYGHTSCVELLLAAGAKPNAATYRDNYTPLLSAAAAGHTACVELLLAAGANPNDANTYRETPLTLSVRFGHLDIVKMLLSAGVDSNTIIHNNKETAATWLIKNGEADFVNKLCAAKNTSIYSEAAKVHFWGRSDNNRSGEAPVGFGIVYKK